MSSTLMKHLIYKRHLHNLSVVWLQNVTLPPHSFKTWTAGGITRARRQHASSSWIDVSVCWCFRLERFCQTHYSSHPALWWRLLASHQEICSWFRSSQQSWCQGTSLTVCSPWGLWWIWLKCGFTAVKNQNQWGHKCDLCRLCNVYDASRIGRNPVFLLICDSGFLWQCERYKSHPV